VGPQVLYVCVTLRLCHAFDDQRSHAGQLTVAEISSASSGAVTTSLAVSNQGPMDMPSREVDSRLTRCMRKARAVRAVAMRVVAVRAVAEALLQADPRRMLAAELRARWRQREKESRQVREYKTSNGGPGTGLR
jgi:hypothetical protein